MRVTDKHSRENLLEFAAQGGNPLVEVTGMLYDILEYIEQDTVNDTSMSELLAMVLFASLFFSPKQGDYPIVVDLLHHSTPVAKRLAVGVVSALQASDNASEEEKAEAMMRLLMILMGGKE